MYDAWGKGLVLAINLLEGFGGQEAPFSRGTQMGCQAVIHKDDKLGVSSHSMVKVYRYFILLEGFSNID